MRIWKSERNDRKRWKMTGALAAVLVLSALSGAVFGGGTALAVQPVFCPQGITAGPENSLLVTDCYSKVVWTLEAEEQRIYAGKPGPEGLYGEPVGGYGDGALLQMRMESPWDIVPYLEGYAISDSGNHVVRYIDANGSKTLAGRGKEGYEDNRGGRALLSAPTGLAADSDGNLYIADTGNDVIRRLGADGRVDTYLRGLSGPVGLCWHDGALYVADTGNHRVLKVENGAIVWAAGSEQGQQDGSLEEARFSSPAYIAAAADGTIYVSDTGNGAVRRIRDGAVSTLVLDTARYPGAELTSPAGLLAIGEELYVCDSFSRRIFTLIR